MRTKATNKNSDENGNRDYSHLQRTRDFKLPKKISPELKELMKATREAMEALQLKEVCCKQSKQKLTLTAQ